MNGRVLVIGGTGKLGRLVVPALHAAGYRVRVLSRSGRPVGEVETVSGDVGSEQSLRAALAGCTAVHVSLRGGPDAAGFDRVEAEGTAQIARVAAELGLDRLTYVSHSLADTASRAPDLRAKARAEEAVAASGVPYTIFRPTYFLDTLPGQVRGSRANVLGRQPHRLHLLAGTDFADLVVRSLAVPEAVGQRLDVHGPEALTIADALAQYCRLSGVPASVRTLPLPVAAVLDRTVLRGQLRATLPLMREIARHGERGDPGPTNRLLGPPSTTLAEWVASRPIR